MVAEKLRQVTAGVGASFIDLTDIFGAIEDDAFTDDCHLTPLANRAIAEYIGDRIVPLIVAALSPARDKHRS